MVTMGRDFSRFLRLDDPRRTIVELRDLLTPELRAPIASEVLAFEEAEAERCRHVVTLGMRDGRPLVLFENGENRCVIRVANEDDPPESWFGEDLRYARPVEALTHALWLLRQDHAASFPARFNWDRSEGIFLAHRRARDIARFARQTLANVGAHWWRSSGHTSVLWRDRHEGFARSSPWATLVVVGEHLGLDWIDARLRTVELAQDAGQFQPGNVHHLLECTPELDPRALDLRFLDPHVRSSNLVMVLASDEVFEREIAWAVARHCADGERLVVLLGPDAMPTDGVDLAFCVGFDAHRAVEAMAAIFESGVLGFDTENLRVLGQTSAVTGIASEEARTGRFQHLLGAAFDCLGWSPARLSCATAFLLVVLAPYDTRLADLESLVVPVESMVGPEPTVLIQFVIRERTSVRLTLLAFEPVVGG